MVLLPPVRPALLWLLWLVTGSYAGQAILCDDFSAKELDPAWTLSYEEPSVRPGLSRVRGFLLVRHSTCWRLSRHEIDIGRYPHGVRLAADIFFYPRPGFEWQQTSAPYPLGFQDEAAGVGAAYARFAFIDADGDGLTDALRFETSAGQNPRTTDLPGYNPAVDQEFHRLAIDWTPGAAVAWFDGRVFARHDVRIGTPLWAVGRNEYINVLMDQFELMVLDEHTPPPVATTFSPSTRPALRTRASPPRYWCLAGLHHEAYKIAEALPSGTLTVSDGWSDGMRPPLPPIEAEALAEHDVAILANVDLRSIGPGGRRTLAGFLAGGGGLLVLGGQSAYARGGWRGSSLEGVLPVRVVAGGWDIRSGGGAALRAGQRHWITDGLDLSAAPQIECLHEVAAVRESAGVLLYAGDKPFLAAWDKGPSRIACILGTPYGPADRGVLAWTGWPALLQRTLLWLAHRDQGSNR